MPQESSRCKTCGALIIWARSVGGKMMPMDSRGETMYSLVRGDDGKFKTEARYVHRPHFATCPDADLHRKKNNG